MMYKLSYVDLGCLRRVKNLNQLVCRCLKTIDFMSFHLVLGRTLLETNEKPSSEYTYTYNLRNKGKAEVLIHIDIDHYQ